MKILVTGSEGMIGKHLCFALRKRGHEVFGVDRKIGISLQQIPSFIERVDMVVHLAATCSTTKGLQDPKEAMDDNVMGTFHVLEFAAKNRCPIIYTSSIKAEKCRGMRTPYGLTKYMGELMVKEWEKSYGVSFIINRPGTIYGPFQDASSDSGWLSWFILSSILNSPIIMNGDGEQIRDVLYVEDYVDLLIDQIEHFSLYKGKTFRVGGGKENAVSIKQIADMLHIDYTHGKERLGDARIYIADNKVSNIRGWRPKTGYKEGIQKTLTYYRGKYL